MRTALQVFSETNIRFLISEARRGGTLMVDAVKVRKTKDVEVIQK